MKTPPPASASPFPSQAQDRSTLPIPGSAGLSPRSRHSFRLGLIGLGAMGLPMGRRLLAAGYALAVVPHRNPEPARDLENRGAAIKSTYAELAAECDLVITCLPNWPQVEEVLFGENGLAASLRSGSDFRVPSSELSERDTQRVPGNPKRGTRNAEGATAAEGGRKLTVVDMSSIKPSAARDFHSRLGSLGIAMLDAPVSGGPSRAADGTLTIMVGGDAATFERALPALQALGQPVVHVGPPGAGQVVKMANQLMISIIMLANAEALTLGVKAGVPLETLTGVISTSSGSNYLMTNWLPRTYFSGDLRSGFALELLLKDVDSALESARELGVPSFAGSLARQLYGLAAEAAGTKDDYSSVLRLYEQWSGVQLRPPEGPV